MDPWTPTQQGGDPPAIDDPHCDHERALRDLVDELLDEDDSAARSVLSSLVARAQLDELDRAFLVVQHPRLSKMLRDRLPDPSSLRQETEVDQRVVDAMHAIYYADLIAGTSRQDS